MSQHCPDHSPEIGRINRIIGQLDGVKRMIDEGRYCPDILTQLKAVHSAVRAVEQRMLETHMRACVVEAMAGGDEAEIEAKIEELSRLFKRG